MKNITLILVFVCAMFCSHVDYAAFPIKAKTAITLSTTATSTEKPAIANTVRTHPGMVERFRTALPHLWPQHSRQYYRGSSKSNLSVLSFCLLLGGYGLLLLGLMLTTILSALPYIIMLLGLGVILSSFVVSINALAQHQRLKGLAIFTVIYSGFVAASIVIGLLYFIVFLIF